jgi:hypothetical protein
MTLSINSNTTPNLTSGSISTCEDIEEGGYSSQDEEFFGKTEAQDEIIVPKHILVGGYTRRLSACENLPRRRSKQEADASLVSCYQNLHCLTQTTQFVAGAKDSAPKFKAVLYSIIFILIATTMGYFSQHSRVQALHHQLNALHESRRNLEESHTQLSHELKTASFNLAQFKNTHEKMKKVNHDMGEHMRRLKEEERRNNVVEMEKRAEKAEGRLQSIVDSIRVASREQVIKKYGHGPHQVELFVTLPGSHAVEKIQLDLASIDTKYGMPHAVHTFLDQVSAKAWDGAAFAFHAGHVLLAVPPPTPVGSQAVKTTTTLLFPEYNNAYPHEKYTVAFPGREGTGQDFYINLRSNVIHHSPRIENGEFIEGEPVFARILDEDSKSVVDNMNNLSVNSNGSLKQVVTIQKARIVGFAESS